MLSSSYRDDRSVRRSDKVFWAKLRRNLKLKERAMAESNKMKAVELDELTFIKNAVTWLQKQDLESQARIVRYLNDRFNSDSWNDYRND